jgi:site-specific DNA recombinase
MRKYVVYQRVSCEEQAEKGISLEAMLERCRHYIAAQEGAELVDVYEDAGFSGTLPPEKRPALSKLLEEVKARSGRFDTVLIWKLDRLSRSLRDTLNIAHMLSKADVSLESVTERLDTSTASGRMFFATIASFAEFEAAQTGERTRNAMAHLVAKKPLGGKPAFGYRLRRCSLVVYEQEAEVVRLIYQQFTKSKNLSKVSRYLNAAGLLSSAGKKFDHEKVKRILLNPIYCGWTVWGRRLKKYNRMNKKEQWVVKPKTHDLIISEQVYNRAQAILRRQSVLNI